MNFKGILKELDEIEHEHPNDAELKQAIQRIKDLLS